MEWTSSGTTTCCGTTRAAASSSEPPSPLLEVPETHAENAERVRNMAAILARGPLADRMSARDGRHAEVEELRRCTTRDYVEAVGRRPRPRRRLHALDAGVARLLGAAIAAAGTALAPPRPCSTASDARLRARAPARPPRPAHGRRLLLRQQHGARRRARAPQRASTGSRSSTGTSTTATARRRASTSATTC